MRKFFVAALILLLAHTPALAASGVISGAIRWDAWYEKHASDAEFHLAEALEAKAVRVTELLSAGLALVDRLPAPAAL